MNNVRARLLTALVAILLLVQNVLAPGAYAQPAPGAGPASTTTPDQASNPRPQATTSTPVPFQQMSQAPSFGASALPRQSQSVSVTRHGRTGEVHPLQTVRTSDGREAVADRIIVGYQDNVSPSERQAVHAQAETRGLTVARTVQAVSATSDLVDVSGAASVEDAARIYRADPRVRFAQPDLVLKKAEVPNDPLIANQWGLNKISAPGAWDQTHGSSTAYIAMLDCGVFDEHAEAGSTGHEDLVGKVVLDANIVGSPLGTDDFCDHGTRTAGVAAAATNNFKGVAGTGYSAQMFNVKVLDDTGAGSESTVLTGIRYAADNGAKVINMSLGGPGNCSTAAQDAVDYAWSKGAVIVASAGNAGTSNLVEPASCNHVISVAATDQFDNRASFSTFGTWVTAAAPGVSILSSDTFGGYSAADGTSFSAPFVSGLASLLWATAWGTSNESVVARIKATADPIAGTGTLWQSGRINAAAAVQPPATLTVTPTTVANSGSVTASWTTVPAPATNDWIGLFRPGDSDLNYISFVWTSSCTNSAVGTTARASGSCPFTMSGLGGTFELRYFSHGTFIRLAKPATVTEAPFVPAVLNVSPTSVVGGNPVNAAFSNVTPAATNDWIGLFPLTAADSAYLDYEWTSSCTKTVGSTAQSAGTCSFPMPATAGSYELRLFRAGTFTKLATSATITVTAPPPPALSVSPTAAAGGNSVSASFSNVIPAATNDWIGLFQTGDADAAYLDYEWTSSCSKAQGATAVSSGTCAFPMPATSGSYELRLFRAGTFTKLATSATITVSGAPAPALSVSPTTIVGGNPVTASFSNVTPDATNDWIGLFHPGDADTAYSDYEWTSSCSKTQAATAVGSGTCAFPMPTTAGSYELRLFRAGTFTKLATSATITVTAPPPPALSVSSTSVAAGGAVSASFSNVPNPATNDWIGLFHTGDPDTGYMDYEWTSSCSKTQGSTGVSSGACSFPMPATPGTYELRLFSSGTFTRLASPQTITVN